MPTAGLERIFEALFNDRSDVPEIDQNKFLVPADLSVGQFVYVIRKRIKLSTEKAIYIFVKTCFHRRLRACLRLYMCCFSVDAMSFVAIVCSPNEDLRRMNKIEMRIFD